MRFLARGTWSPPLLLVATMLASPLAAQEKVDVATIERIKTEALDHSQVMDIMSWLTDVYGPRLTWSPNARKAADWSVQQLKQWGLANVHLEPWSTPTGIGWQNERFSLQAVSPNPFILQATPRAWSAGTDGKVTGPAMRIDVDCFAELRQQYAGKLKSAFLMFTPPDTTPVTEFTAYASRRSDSALAAAGGGADARGGRSPAPRLSHWSGDPAGALAGVPAGGRRPGGRCPVPAVAASTSTTTPPSSAGCSSRASPRS